MSAWLQANWPQLTTALAGTLLILVGLVDVETTARLGVEWDRSQIVLGAGLLAGVSVPLLPRAVVGLRS